MTPEENRARIRELIKALSESLKGPEAPSEKEEAEKLEEARIFRGFTDESAKKEAKTHEMLDAADRARKGEG